MYIEYTPLEGHLQTILKNPATAAALLAHAESEEAATQVQANSVEDDVAYRNATSATPVARVTNTVSDLAHFTINPRRFRNTEQKQRATFDEVSNLSEEEDQEYELIDVVESEEEPQREIEQQPPENTSSAIEYNYVVANGDQSLDLPNNSNNIVIAVEDEDFSYVVTKLPKKESSARSQKIRNSRVLHKTSANASAPKRVFSTLRPIPPKFPLPPHRKSSPYVLHQTKSAPSLKLLNGNLHKFYPNSEDSDCSSQNSYIYVPRPKHPIRASSKYYQNSISGEEEDYEDFDYVENKTRLNLNTFPVVNTPNGEIPDSQMGIDIVNRLCRLLHLNSRPKNDESNEGNRKRRCDDWSPDAVDDHQIKYRKVDNHFPKFITGPLDDDAIDSFPYPKKPRKPLHLQQHHHFDNYPPVAMSQRRSVNSTDKSKQRRSIFAPPQTIHRLVRNTPYADIEFSDDDEPELISSYNMTKKTAKNCNIPMNYSSDGTTMIGTGARAPPPPLIDANTGSILASTLLPEITARPSYADAVRKSLTGHVLGHATAPTTSTPATSKSGAAFLRPVNSLIDTIRSSAWGPGSRSILTEEKQSHDREKYEELLKKLVPRIYGTDENASPAATKAATEARRRSSLLAAAAAAAAGKEPPVNDKHSSQMSKPQIWMPRQRGSLTGQPVPLPRQPIATSRQQVTSTKQRKLPREQTELTPEQISLLKEQTSSPQKGKEESLHRKEESLQRKEESLQHKEESLPREQSTSVQRKEASLKENSFRGDQTTGQSHSGSLSRKELSRPGQQIPAIKKVAPRPQRSIQQEQFMLPWIPHSTAKLDSVPHMQLSSTITLDDDDDDDKTIANEFDPLKFYRAVVSKQNNIDDNDISDISDIIDLEDDETFQKLYYSRPVIELSDDEESEKDDASEQVDVEQYLPYVEPVNSLKLQLNASPHLKDDWLENWEKRWVDKKKERKAEAQKIEKEAEKHTRIRRAAEDEIQERLKNFHFFSPELVIIDEFPEPTEKKESEYVELTAEHRDRIKSVMVGPADQVLIAKFNLNITRRDIYTLLGHNWLNDEVINFYMNLLTERGEKRSASDGLPTVYAMNTFFIPRLMQAGHSSVKRWTRKVDIFARDVIPVPVHVGGVHWCMAIIHLKDRTIKYYDSMGTPNPTVLKALEQYLKDESMDKRKQPFDTSKFLIESVAEVPRQLNGSDCGVFSCMFAEYITRNREITFTQQQMEYFRQKMMLEILQGELLQ